MRVSDARVQAPHADAVEMRLDPRSQIIFLHDPFVAAVPVQLDVDPPDIDHASGDVITALQTGTALSARERQVCALIISGLSMTEAASQLAVSLHSATSDRRRAFQKLGITNQRELFGLGLASSRMRPNGTLGTVRH